MDLRSNPEDDLIAGRGHDPNYRVVVVRLWRQDRSAAWRLTAQEAGAPGRQSFADLDSFMAHLLRLMAEPPAAQQDLHNPDDE